MKRFLPNLSRTLRVVFPKSPCNTSRFKVSADSLHNPLSCENSSDTSQLIWYFIANKNNQNSGLLVLSHFLTIILHHTTFSTLLCKEATLWIRMYIWHKPTFNKTRARYLPIDPMLRNSRMNLLTEGTCLCLIS